MKIGIPRLGIQHIVMESRHSQGSPAACASPAHTEHKDDSPQGAASVDPDAGEIRPSAALPSAGRAEEE